MWIGRGAAAGFTVITFFTIIRTAACRYFRSALRWGSVSSRSASATIGDVITRVVLGTGAKVIGCIDRRRLDVRDRRTDQASGRAVVGIDREWALGPEGHRRARARRQRDRLPVDLIRGMEMAAVRNGRKPSRRRGRAGVDDLDKAVLGLDKARRDLDKVGRDLDKVGRDLDKVGDLGRGHAAVNDRVARVRGRSRVQVDELPVIHGCPDIIPAG
jgi:hypothetical protein